MIALFNPDNDMALADFTPGYTPPRIIRQMMDELAPLAHIWGDGPWGWSPAACHRLQRMGVPACELPNQEQLRTLRRLSSRETAVKLLHDIRRDIPTDTCGESVFCTSEKDVQTALSRWQKTILKAPWSSSGKGIRFGQGEREDTLANWTRNLLQTQGGVVVEKLLDKDSDLAMEFYSDGNGHISYQGLSLFTTHPNGAYRGNIIASEDTKMRWLTSRISPHLVEQVKEWLCLHLAGEIGLAYKGYLGVDMLIARPETPAQPLMLCPLIEVNLRLTMGMLAIMLQPRLPQDIQGEFRVEYAPGQPLPQGAVMLAGGEHYRAYYTF